MAVTALITWIITAGFGFVLLGTWLRNGGMARGAGPASTLAPPLVLGHFLLAAAGLIVWVIYVVTEAEALAWIAFVALVVVAVLGDVLFLRWLRVRRGQPVGTGAGTELPERKFPVPVVALHGLVAVTTVVLVLLTALGVGTS